MKNMRQICRVLLWVADQTEPVTIEQVADGVGLTYAQARSSLLQLRVKQKLTATEGHNNRSFYRYNEDYEAPDRPKMVKCHTTVAKALERKVPASLSSMFSFVDKKVELLTRLKARCVDGDADLIDGMIRDYNQLKVRKSA